MHQLLDYLMGDSDGIPKDPNCIFSLLLLLLIINWFQYYLMKKDIFRLYMALGNFAQAAKTAVIIARSEQELGNYKVFIITFLIILLLTLSFCRLPTAFYSTLTRVWSLTILNYYLS